MTFTFYCFHCFNKIWKFNRFILWLIEKGETHENFSELKMLITLFALMTHPLFEWKLRTKIPALRDNFALIIKVNMLDLETFANSISFQDMTGTVSDCESNSDIVKAAKPLCSLVTNPLHIV